MTNQQPILEFNSSLNRLSPEQVLSAFAIIVSHARTSANDNFPVVVLNPNKLPECYVMEFDETPYPNSHPLAIHGVRMSEDNDHREWEYKGPTECLTIIRRGVRDVRWSTLESPHDVELRDYIRARSQLRTNEASRLIKSLDSVENVVMAWYEDRLAESRRHRCHDDRQTIRQELTSIEHATPLLHGVLSELIQVPDYASFKSPRIVGVFHE